MTFIGKERVGYGKVGGGSGLVGPHDHAPNPPLCVAGTPSSESVLRHLTWDAGVKEIIPALADGQPATTSPAGDGDVAMDGADGFHNDPAGPTNYAIPHNAAYALALVTGGQTYRLTVKLRGETSGGGSIMAHWLSDYFDGATRDVIVSDTINGTGATGVWSTVTVDLVAPANAVAIQFGGVGNTHTSELKISGFSEGTPGDGHSDLVGTSPDFEVVTIAADNNLEWGYLDAGTSAEVRLWQKSEGLGAVIAASLPPVDSVTWFMRDLTCGHRHLSTDSTHFRITTHADGRPQQEWRDSEANCSLMPSIGDGAYGNLIVAYTTPSESASRCGHAHHLLRQVSPTANDDVHDGLPITTQWTDTLTGRSWLLIDNTAGAAVWLLYATGDHGSLAGLGDDDHSMYIRGFAQTAEPTGRDGDFWVEG